MAKLTWKYIFTDIRTWILVFFLIRLIGITNPPLDIAHSWRQVTGNMVSRNFLEIDANILYPRVDMAGEKSGITGTEFPLLNYLIYLVSVVFGWQHWYGRLIVLIISSIGCLYFFKIVRKLWGEKTSFFATLLLLSSNWFIYSRKIMPDTFSVSLVLIGIYYTLVFIDKKNIMHLLLGGVLILCGGLSKIPALLVAIPLVTVFWDSEINRHTKTNLFLCFSIVGLPIVFWYFYWVPYLVEKYGYWHYYMGTNLMNGLLEITHDLRGVAEKFYFDALKFSGFILFIFGLWILFFKNRKTKMLHLLKWMVVIEIIFFGLFMIKAGRNFWVHSYYIIPFVPIMALIAGYGLANISSRKIAFTVLLIVILEGIANQQHDFKIDTTQLDRNEYKKWADTFSKKEELFVINGGNNPKDLYFTHRKGWSIEPSNATNIHLIDSLSKCGAKYLWIVKKENPFLKISKPIVFENKSVVAYKL